MEPQTFSNCFKELLKRKTTAWKNNQSQNKEGGFSSQDLGGTSKKRSRKIVMGKSGMAGRDFIMFTGYAEQCKGAEEIKATVGEKRLLKAWRR